MSDDPDQSQSRASGGRRRLRRSDGDAQHKAPEQESSGLKGKTREYTTFSGSIGPTESGICKRVGRHVKTTVTWEEDDSDPPSLVCRVQTDVPKGVIERGMRRLYSPENLRLDDDPS